jgi:endoglucanase
VFDLIKELTELPGPVGQEGPVLERIEAIWREAGGEISRTRVGNVLARVGERGPRVMLIAHGDELCFMVRAIDESGFLWLANGQAWTRTWGSRNFHTVGERVTVLARSGPIPGFVASPSGHVMSFVLKELNELTWDDFWVETGLSREELLARGVTPGTRVIWDRETMQYGQQIVGKALDDRVPLAVITELLRRVPAVELGCRLTLACTVQEEIGVAGAWAIGVTQGQQYDAAIVVEIGLSGDIPGVGQNALPVKLGAGPILIHKDSGIHYDHALTLGLERVAERAGITIQHAVFSGFGSDGQALIKSDVPSAMVAFPARYTHSPFETGHLGDIERLTDWLCAFVREPDGVAG